MCMSAPKVPTPPPPAQFQPMQQPVTMANTKSQGNRRMRGLYASLFTGPQGIGSRPTTTGTTGGSTGG
jgi:hypothetical protein